MSDMERNKGKLIPLTKIEIEQDCPNIADWDDLEWETDAKYIKIGEQYYQAVWEVYSDTDSTSFADVTENEDGTISFHTYHYNGGAHWSELVEEELSK